MKRLRLASLCWLCIAAALPSLVSAIFSPHAPAWRRELAPEQEVTPEWVSARQARVLFVDARSEAAFRQDGISGAVNLYEGQWDELLPGFLDLWRPENLVVVYCDERCDSAQSVARRLRRELNIDATFVLQGGRKAWLKGTR
jgi:rhodanese-related sulfurtransferase